MQDEIVARLANQLGFKGKNVDAREIAKDLIFLAGKERIFEGMRKAGVPEG
jgi:hypothetical protein